MTVFRRLQSESLIIDQDIRKKSRYHENLVAEIRKMKSDLSRLETSLREKQTEEAKFARDLALLQAEAGRVRKRMNLLS